jgi:predicted negative regulator of RcsB-dependent stress response
VSIAYTFTVADGVSIATALVLALGAFFAWKTYGLSNKEHEEARQEAGRAPRRERLDDIYRELKYLVVETQKRDNSGYANGQVAGHQKRLELALAFVNDPLPKTRAVAEAEVNQILQPGLIEAAAREIAEAVDQSFTS